MNSLRFKQVDVFTRTPFLGNPVAVVLGAEKLAAEEMQRIAAWTNLSETTFVLPASSDAADYRLRIFTPKRELPFAGHPTIGSAHAVIESGFAVAQNGRLRQECLAGCIDLSIERDEDGERIFIRAPQPKISSVNSEQAQRLAAALGSAQNPPLRIDVGVVWLIVELNDARAVDGVAPDLATILKISEETDAAGVTIFGRSNGTDLHVRSFAPALGVPEDPVCGSGNASVAAYLIHNRLLSETARYEARQGMNVGRAGRVSVRVEGQEIYFGGAAVTCVDGTLRVA
jgi:PhzF family phenazine biosynthesis protein